MNNGDIVSCGGKSKICYILRNGKWFKHSTMNNVRTGAVGIQMPNGIYMFGGDKSPNTSEFLPNNTNIWQEGPDIPYFYTSLFSLPSRFSAKGHAISKTELILIIEDCTIKGHSCNHLWSSKTLALHLSVKCDIKVACTVKSKNFTNRYSSQ